MRVIAYDRFKPGVTMETIQPLLAEEVANVWRRRLPITKAGWLEWFYIPLMAPVMLESQFSDLALARAGLAPDSQATIGAR
jgi:hypothetical protein